MYLNNQFRSDVRIKWTKNQKEVWWRLINGKLKPKGERAWVLKAWDTSSNRQEILAVRFSDVQLAQSFAQKFHAVFPQLPQQQQQQQYKQQFQPPQQQQFFNQQQNFNQGILRTKYDCCTYIMRNFAKKRSISAATESTMGCSNE